MNIILQSPGFKASAALEEFLNVKLSKLDQHTDKIVRANVTLFKGAETEQHNNYCEIRLEVPGNDHFAKKNSNSFEHAITECINALNHMIEKSKDKEHSQRHAATVADL
jgi:putative sigma-54 modulation protein